MKRLGRLFTRPGTVLIGLHFAKSGGTSLQAHASRHFADRTAVHGYGPRANTERLFAGERLLEEYTDRELDQVRFVFGHGVGADVPALFPERRVRLFTACRDPFDRFVSSYKHHLRTERSGERQTARGFFGRQPENPFATNVLGAFGAYAGGDEDRQTTLVGVLRNFEFVLSTEQLDAQSAALFGAIDLPPLDARKRVYPDEPDLGDLTREEVYGRDRLDLMVDRSVNDFFAGRAHGSGDTLNPFGVDTARRKEYGERLRRGIGRAALVERAYTRLFDVLRSQDRLVAAGRFLSIRDPNAVAPRLDRYCAANGLTLDEEALGGNGLGFLGEALLRADRVDEARDVLSRAIARHPDNLLCLFVLAQCHWKTGDWRQAAEYSRRAVDLNATHTRSLVLLGRAQMKLDRLTEARESLSRAQSLEPARPNIARLLAEVEERLGQSPRA